MMYPHGAGLFLNFYNGAGGNKLTLMKQLLLLFFSIGSVCCFGQNSFSKIDGWMKDNLPELGGRAVMVIWKDGKAVYTHSENNLSGRQKMIGKFIAKRHGKDADEVTKDFTLQSKEMIASCSKWLSAALVMTFVDEGKLSLEDTVGKYLPILTKNGKGNIKIWHCLSHLTGIKAANGKESISEMKDLKTMEDAIAKIAVMPVESEPGKGFHYSNAGLQIAAAVIEKISGKDFETLFQERIAKPCSMKNTDYGNKNVPLAAGGARSTTEDYINFLVMILNEGRFNNKQVLSSKAVVAMQQNRTANVKIFYSPVEAGNWGYGFGEWTMENTKEGSAAVSSPGLFGSFPWIDNNKKYVAMLFTFNIKSEGRNERYKALKALVDEAIL